MIVFTERKETHERKRKDRLKKMVPDEKNFTPRFYEPYENIRYENNRYHKVDDMAYVTEAEPFYC